MNAHCLITFAITIFLSVFSGDSCAKTLSKTDSLPAKFLIKVSDRINKINSSSFKEEEKLIQLKSIIEESIDVEKIANFVLNRSIKGANNAQKLSLKNAYKNHLIKKYSKLLSTYDGEISINDVRELGPNRFSVSTTVEDNQNNKINVSYSIFQNNENSFLIYDILLADGISLAISDRDEISGFIEKNGLEKFAQKLEEKN